MDLDKIQEVVYSLSSDEYVKFMNALHFNCPFKTKSLTDEIIGLWKNDYSMKTDEFNELINERQAERTQAAREKRQRDLKRIQDIKSSVGSSPLELFPKEIWMMILDELLPEDKRNIREVHQTFRDLTDNRIIEKILLPLILGFKMERLWRENFTEKRFPTLTQHTELRLVSKSMRNAVDQCYDNDLISTLRNGRKDMRPRGAVVINLLDVDDDLEKVKKMKTELFKNSVRFFTRSLRFIFPGETYFDLRGDPEQFADLLESINAVLDRVGDRIWHFSFEFSRASEELSTRYPRALLKHRYGCLLEWLAKMPNLKWLKISIDESEKESKKDKFRTPQRSRPPTLRNLERLDLELKQSNRHLLPVYNGFIKANPHVKILNLAGFGCTSNDGFGVMVLDSVRALPSSLEALMIKALPERLDDSTESDYEEGFQTSILNNFISISSTNYPLKRVDLELNAAKPRSIFGTLNKFHETLEKVTLFIEELTINDDIVFLRLPRMTHFKLSFKNRSNDFSDFMDSPGDSCNWSFFFSLQFLVYAKKLNTLIWKCDMYESAWRKVQRDFLRNHPVGEMIDFAGGIWDIRGNSNLWRVFPWLETVQVDRVMGDRDGPGKKSFSKVYRRRERRLKPKPTLSC